MNLVKAILDSALSKLLRIYSIFASVVVYEPDGEVSEWLQESFTHVLDSQDRTLTTGSSVGPFNWVDISRSGNPRFNFAISAAGTYRDIKFLIDYGEMVGSVMEVVDSEDTVSTGPLEYTTQLFMHTVHLSRVKGLYARVREITNDGDGTVVISGRAPSLVRPILETLTVLDRERVR